MNKAISIISILIGFISFGQEIQLDRIDEMVKSIELDSTQTLTEFDWNVLTGITTGSKGIRRIWTNGKHTTKIVEEIKFLDYTTWTTMYLENGVPIKIIEKEGGFENSKNGLDYSKHIEVFSAVVYVFDWENDKSKIIRNGTRVFTEVSCSTFDYETLLENIQTE
ncbi:hypothetical protein [Maribacter sp. HTCC2170]|uniref:hypothetical protein n=1 Tax=Maribacter sp. (strain HTCC2170 / KCCM 42371) TaxID=313603 RepID=UPI00006B4701|nr:hypothetical protein [Maribacter sp. HTCC2170]EAR01927.1 hypothetical protein FB2170_15403 [Maribacter sp. HTCC2170]